MHWQLDHSPGFRKNLSKSSQVFDDSSLVVQLARRVATGNVSGFPLYLRIGRTNEANFVEIKYVRPPFTNGLAEEILGVTDLEAVEGHGGKTTIPKQALEILKLRYSPQNREKLLWRQEGGEVVVTKGNPQSDFRKSMLSRGDTTAVPKHICEALKLKFAPDREERLVWIQRGKDVLVRKEEPQKT